MYYLHISIQPQCDLAVHLGQSRGSCQVQTCCSWQHQCSARASGPLQGNRTHSDSSLEIPTTENQYGSQQWSSAACALACKLTCSCTLWHMTNLHDVRKLVHCSEMLALQLVRTECGCMCCAVLRRRAGYPFGTLVDFASDGGGMPIFCLSPLAIHARNLIEDPRCSLVVQMPGWTGLANARVTIFGDTYQLPADMQVGQQRACDSLT